MIRDQEYIHCDVRVISTSLSGESTERFGCDCNEVCDASTCSCLYSLNNYDSLGCLLSVDQYHVDHTVGGAPPILECFDQCGCAPQVCGNRAMTRNTEQKFEVFCVAGKGCGLRSRGNIYKGQFVIEYVGEVISCSEAYDREKTRPRTAHCYTLMQKEHYGTSTVSTCVDANRLANDARFINHSCDPNLAVVPVRLSDPVIPHLALFALRDIPVGEELSYSYGSSPVLCDSDSVNGNKRIKCSCGSANCQGFLPFDPFAYDC